MTSAKQKLSALQPLLEHRFSALQQRIGSHAEVAANLASLLAALCQDTANLSAEFTDLISADMDTPGNEAVTMAELIRPAQENIIKTEEAKTAELSEDTCRPRVENEIVTEKVFVKTNEEARLFDGCLPEALPGHTTHLETVSPEDVHVKRRGAKKLEQGNDVANLREAGDIAAKNDFNDFDAFVNGDDDDAFWAGRVFADPEDLKTKIRANLSKPAYDVRNFYHESGIFQLLAKDPRFEAVSIFVVSLNSVWISIDLDLNEAENLSDANAIFQIVAHAFCLFFCSEQLIRFLAFRHKKDAINDFWFMFDLVMVFAIVLDTWIMTVILAIVGSGVSSGSPRILVVFRTFRLLRVVRLVRVLRTIPEVVVILRGIGIAFRAILVILVLIGFIIYIAAIVLRVVLEDTAIGAKQCSSVLSCMGVLLLDGTLSGAKGVPMMYEANKESILYSVLIFIFVLIANITCMGVLSGLLVQTVKTVAECEKEEKAVKCMQAALNHLWELITMHDDDGDGRISHEELHRMLCDSNTGKLLHKMDVDVEGVVTVAGFVLDTEGGTLSKTSFKQMILDLRNKNVAKVKDLVETRKFVHKEFRRAGLVEDAASTTPASYRKPGSARSFRMQKGSFKLTSRGTFANLA